MISSAVVRVRILLPLLLCTLSLIVGAAFATRWAGTDYVLASFTTDLENRNDAQRSNILLAASHIDGKIVPAKSLFSFNETVGQRLVEDGYEKAASYQGDGVADTPGGGICQLSSTLYNAALLAGLRVVERAPHVARVLSVGAGRDATVVYGRCDLRFANPYAFPIRLQARAEGQRLVVEVLGSRPLPSPVSVRVERVASVDGVRVQTWRRMNGVETLLSQDHYVR